MVVPAERREHSTRARSAHHRPIAPEWQAVIPPGATTAGPDRLRARANDAAGRRPWFSLDPFPRPSPRSAAMDKLEEIFQMQDALNRRIGVNLPPASDEEKAKWILNYTRALQQETAELIDSVPWKWWAKYQKFDEQNAKVEVVDLFHFLVSLAQTLGMTADDVYQAYLKKNQVNHQRQDSGYVKKDEADSKHI